MNRYLIRVNYEGLLEERPSDLKAIKVPDDVKVTDVLKELTVLNHTLFALCEIENYECLQDCLESELYDDELERGKEICQELFKTEDDVQDIYSNEGNNAHTLFSRLIELHPDWDFDRQIVTAVFEFDE